jgi:putative colanic acid biosynthesis glycosyltransferase
MISIITVTYNNLQGLRNTAESITAQTVQNYEWIVIDGGSTDGSKEFLEQTNALFTSEPDHGIYDAMNKGLERITGDYIIFLNGGDQFAEKKTLEKLYQEIEQQNQPDFIYGPALEERLGYEPVQKPAIETKFLFWGMITHHQAMLYKSIIARNLIYNTSYKIAADYDFTRRFLNHSKTVHMTLYPICLFEAGGLSQQAVKQGRQEQFDIRRQLKITSAVLNYGIYFLQSAVMFLRQKAPGLYWFLRSRLKKSR